METHPPQRRAEGDRRPNVVVVLIPAAGSSRRLGRPKALVTRPDGRTLLAAAIDAARGAGLMPVVTVAAGAAEVIAEVERQAARIIQVDDAAAGLSASIRAGVTALVDDPDIDAVLVVLCGQWAVSTREFLTLTAAWRSDPTRVVAAGYAGTVGVPAVFGRTFFNALRDASGDAGARDFLRDPSSPVTVIDLPQAEHDVDTVADVEAVERG